MPRESISVSPDLVLPRVVTVQTSTAISGGISLTIEASWSDEERRYVMTGLQANRPVGDGGISAVDLQSIPVMRLLERGLGTQVRVSGNPDSAFPVRDSKPAGFADLDKRAQLTLAARRYALSRAVGRSPLKDLAAWLEVSQSTASRIAAQARQEGLLD